MVPPRKPSVYAAFQPRFCRYLTEYSENTHFQPHFLARMDPGISIPVFRSFVKSVLAQPLRLKSLK